MTFVIIGGGPTGSWPGRSESWRMAHQGDFRTIDPAQATILLLEGAERILATFPPDLSAKAAEDLTRLGVTVRTGTLVTEVRDSADDAQRRCDRDHPNVHDLVDGGQILLAGRGVSQKRRR